MSDEDIIKDARETFNRAKDVETRNRKDALDDLRFARLGEQWPIAIRRDREIDGRPCLTINRLPSFIRQVVNDARQNKPAIDVHPVDDSADVDTAEIFSGLIRNIEVSSDAEVAYDTALDFAVTCGFGYFKINTRYAHDDGFDQDIVIERVSNPLAIYGDPDSTAADSSDWNSAFELDTLSQAAFKAKYGGDAEALSFDSSQDVQRRDDPDDQVVIASCWAREEVKKTIYLLSAPAQAPMDPMQHDVLGSLASQNMVVDAETYKTQKALFDALGVQIMAQREVPGYKVTQRVMSGADILETVDWKGKFIPIVPVYGEELNIEGQRYFRSLVRDAKDPQRMFNYWRTTSTELVALAPKAPFIGPKGAFNTDAGKWATANTQTHAYIEYDGAVAPERQPFSGVPAGALQEALNASDDMKSIMGIFDASLGAKSNETSGKAIMARQREGDVSTFHYIDNLSRAIRHAGRILIDLIPKVYSVERVIRVIGPEGDQRPVKINAPTTEQREDPKTGEIQEIEKIYDLTAGKYDLTVKAGPSFTTRREEFVAMATELIRAYPPAAALLMDKIVENFDMPGGDELAQRFEAMLPPPVQGQNPQLEEAKHVVQQLQQELAKVQQEAQAAKADQSAKVMDAQLNAQKLEIDFYNAQTERMKVMADAQLKADAAQTEADLQSEVVQ